MLFNQFDKLRLAFGGASVSGEGGGYGFGSICEADAISLLTLAFERGIRVFDSAPIYGFGLSEKRIGKAFKNIRENVFLISKSGVSWHSSRRVNMTNDPQVTQNMLEQSLRDFACDYIDLYMIHWPDPRVDIRRAVEVLERARLKGQIKHIGLCNTNLEDLDKASEISKVEVVQSEYNLLNRKFEDFLPVLKTRQIECMTWGTLDKGIISGSVGRDRKYEKEDCRSSAPWWKKDDVLKKVIAMEKVLNHLQQHGHNGLELAMAHHQRQKGLGLALVGVRNPEQLESLLNAYATCLADDLYQECLDILAKNLPA